MIAVILRWSCDDALEIGTFDLNLPNAERNNGGKRAGENTTMRRSENPLLRGFVCEAKSRRPRHRKTRLQKGPKNCALQTDIPCYLPNSFAIGQPVQVAPLVRATS